jgi:protein involved in polysaccharide export with SLBB domain
LKRTLIRCLLVASTLAATTAQASAQVTRYVDVLPAPNPAGLTDLNDVVLYRSAHPGNQAFDGSLDADAYVVGPGDHFEINIWSPTARSFWLVVTPEGTLIVPSVGEVIVAGHSLTTSRELILDAVREAFPGSAITATLTESRRVRVHVSGMVNVPGTYEFVAGQRLAEAVARAGDVVAGQGSARHVSRSEGGVTESFDLLAFYVHGDVSQNPYLTGGEHIRVAYREPREDQLQISGAVLNPGFVEFHPGDKVSDLIDFAYGFAPRADPARIIVTRMESENGKPKTLNARARRTEDTWTLDSDIELVRGDRVYVDYLPGVGHMATVALYGEVERPGHYSVVEDSTTLSHLVAAAGGLTPDASPLGTQILRLGFPRTVTGDSVPPLVSADIRALLAGDLSQDLALRDRDSIYVPPLALGVQVLGYVKRPGILTYDPESPARAYIERAGGYVNQADQGGVRVARLGTRVLDKPDDDRPPGPGDQILIPGKAKSSTRNIVRDILAVVGVAAVTYIIVDEASK